MDIPQNLVDEIAHGNVVLFLGSGASIGAKNSKGQDPPVAPELARSLAERFLGGELADAPLHTVAELAISERDLPTVQEYIRNLFEEFAPASFHKLLPTFRWAGIATTNFDTIIEKTYAACEPRAQDIVPIIKNGDRIGGERIRSPRSLLLLKLHGCITRATDMEIPFILTTDQYVTHRKGRERVFDHLKGWAYEHTILFVGHSLQDPDIRQMLLELGAIEQRPRFYVVSPRVTEPEVRLWESKRISPLKGSFQDLLTALDSRTNRVLRMASVTAPESRLPIAERFVTQAPRVSPSCNEFLTNDVEYVRRGMSVETVDPRVFYRGFHGGWSAIDQDLDVRRQLEETLLTDVVLNDELIQAPKCRLYVVKGHAGSGKSVLLRRVAREAALSYEKLCVYARSHGRITYDPLRELWQLTNEPVFLFVDGAAERVSELLDLFAKAKKHPVPLTIIVTERHSEWNMSCESLVRYVSDEYELRYLSPSEIDQLLTLLERHKSLGTLQSASPSERRSAFRERAGRQLLVALHEATLGEPFEDIVADEYAQITPHEAQTIYLAVCVLNRLEVPVRAGIIARVLGIRFTDFQERFFKPLEEIIHTSFDKVIRDHVYEARHPHIAQIVFERVLPSPRDKQDMYLRLFTALNVDYDADRTAFRKIIRGRSLLDTFPDHQLVEAIWRSARTVAGEDPYLYQQMAIYEMTRDNGNFDEAGMMLGRAHQLAPYDKTVTHSLAELALRRAEASKTPIQFEQHLLESTKLARSLTGRQATDSHGYHTLAKIGLVRLRRIVGTAEQELPQFEFEQAVKDTEAAISEGLQAFPEDSYLLEAEAQLGNLLSDEIRALSSLRRAFKANPNSPYIALRLGKQYIKQNKVVEALDVYKEALETGNIDKGLEFNYARLLVDMDHPKGEEIEYHLRRAFTEGDRNFEAQFWYARQLYLNSKVVLSLDKFRALRDAPLDPQKKHEVRGAIHDETGVKSFTGRITKMEASFGFISRDGAGDPVFVHISQIPESQWSSFRPGSRVEFCIGFTFGGPTAFNIRLD